MGNPEPNKQLNTEALFVKMAFDGWNFYIKRASDLFEQLTDEQLANETAPGRNTGTYLLGHLTAAHDAMLPLLGLGEKLHPELEKPFLTTADKSGQQFPPVADLKKYWVEVKENMNARFAQLQPCEWFERHTAVSAEDFVKEPHRNRLNIILSRTSHLSYHLAQMMYLKQK